MGYLRFNHMAYLDEDPIEAEARARRARMAAYDRLPAPVRNAIRECDWDVHVLIRIGKYTDPAPLIERIRAVKTARDALDFNQQYAR